MHHLLWWSSVLKNRRCDTVWHPPHDAWEINLYCFYALASLWQHRLSTFRSSVNWSSPVTHVATCLSNCFVLMCSKQRDYQIWKYGRQILQLWPNDSSPAVCFMPNRIHPSIHNIPTLWPGRAHQAVSLRGPQGSWTHVRRLRFVCFRFMRSYLSFSPYF